MHIGYPSASWKSFFSILSKNNIWPITTTFLIKLKIFVVACPWCHRAWQWHCRAWWIINFRLNIMLYSSQSHDHEQESMPRWWRHQMKTFSAFNWPFVRGIHRSPVNSPHKGQWRGALMFSWICVWINDWVNNREAGDLRRYRAHYDVMVMTTPMTFKFAD